MPPVRGAFFLLGAVVLLAGSSTSADLRKKEWWENTLVYQIWPRAFQDSDGNGEGDLQGIIYRLNYIAKLGVDTIWLNPFFTSPLIDSGYDVANYTDVDPLFGDLDDFDELIGIAHLLGLRVIIDAIPNHSSDEHEWFLLSVSRIEPYTDYYIWHSGSIDEYGNKITPNNWTSTYSPEHGSAWTWNDERGEWYYHRFHAKQPDLNLRNENVVQEILDIFDFWLKRGVDGFRIGAASYLLEDENLEGQSSEESAGLLYLFRSYIDSWIAANDADAKLLIAEPYDSNENILTFYGNETHNGVPPFNFRFISNVSTYDNARSIKETIEEWLSLLPTNLSTNWVLSNHDRSRAASRISLDRADGLNMLNLLLPGQAFTYYGEEIAMPDTLVTWDETIDPLGLAQTKDTFASYTRDPARTPMQWEASTSAGFSSNSSTFLPVNPNYETRNVEAQLNSSVSNIAVFKALAELRKAATFTHGECELSALQDDDVLVVKRSLEDYPTYYVIINFGWSRTTVNLTALYDDLPDTLYVIIASSNADLNDSSTVNPTNIALNENASLVLSDTESTSANVQATEPQADEEEENEREEEKEEEGEGLSTTQTYDQTTNFTESENLLQTEEISSPTTESETTTLTTEEISSTSTVTTGIEPSTEETLPSTTDSETISSPADEVLTTPEITTESGLETTTHPLSHASHMSAGASTLVICLFLAILSTYRSSS